MLGRRLEPVFHGRDMIELMIRRALIIIAALAGFAVLAMAVAPWTTSSGPLKAAIARQLRETYGLELTVAGRSTVALLPVPRLKFEDVALAAPEGPPLVRGGHLRGEFSILSLLVGRIEISDLSLHGSRIDVDLDAHGQTAWNTPVDRMRARISGVTVPSTHINRLTITGSYLVFRDGRTGAEAVIRDINLTANWPALASAVDLAGSFNWLGESVDLMATGIRPSALAAGRASPFIVQASAAPGRLRLSGDANLGEDPRVVGRAVFGTRSLRDLLPWAGIGAPLGGLTRALTFEGDFTLDRRGVSWPAVRLTLGGDRLDGALAIRFGGERPLTTGTLAADRLDLSDLFAPFVQARTSAGLWSAEPLDIGPLTAGGDLDLRVSASSAHVGSLRLEDMAANVMVRPGRIDASLGRATLNNGVVKGRLSVAAVAPGLDLRAQGSFERLDSAALLSDLGQNSWFAGSTQGQFVLEGTGESAADIVRQSHGRATLGIRSGELIGIGLHDLVRRPLATPFDWRGGRTPFDQAQIALNVANGVVEIADAGLTAPNIRAALQGRASLADQTIAIKATVEGSATRGHPSPVTVEINGPWNDVKVAPGGRALIQRSGVGQFLRPSEANATFTSPAPAQ
jgi:AsmA protein